MMRADPRPIRRHRTHEDIVLQARFFENLRKPPPGMAEGIDIVSNASEPFRSKFVFEECLRVESLTEETLR